jgi:ribosomal protein S18 acetylase RimI-like enzyme
VYLSGHESRFRKDPLIQDSDFKKLYKTWLDNLLSDSNSKVLISVLHGKIVGFIGFKKKNNLFKIDLIAVDEFHQQKGIGNNLLSAVETSVASSHNEIVVQTQLNNKKACNFYEKYGFTPSKKEYIYHFWK